MSHPFSLKAQAPYLAARHQNRRSSTYSDSSSEPAEEFNPYDISPKDPKAFSEHTDVRQQRSVNVPLIETDPKLATQETGLGKARHLNAFTVMPALLSFVAAGGIAATLLAWLMSHRVLQHPGSESSSFRNAIIAFEPTGGSVGAIGQRLFGGAGDGSTTMYGLAISSIAVRIVTFSTPFILSSFGYLLARIWLEKQRQSQPDSLPTPAQYGLMLNLLGSANLTSLYDTLTYFTRSTRRRPHIPFILSLTASTALIIVFLNVMLSLADLWFHVSASTFLHSFTRQVDSSLLPLIGSDLNTTLCAGPAQYATVPSLTYNGGYANCQHVIIESASSPVAFWGSAEVIDEGAAVVSNNTAISRSRVDFVDGYATLLPNPLPGGLQGVVFPTFAIRSKCSPTPNCSTDTTDPETGTIPLLLCPSSGPHLEITQFPPLNESFSNFSSITVSGGNAASSINQYNLTNNRFLFQGADEPGYTINSVLNPTGAQIVMLWTVDPATIDFPPAGNTSGWYHTTRFPDIQELFAYIGSCEISAYNLSVTYDAESNGASRLSIVGEPSLSNFNISSAIFGALDDLYSNNLASHIIQELQPSLDMSADDFSEVLSRNISFSMLGYVAGLFDRTRAISGEAVTQGTVSRYPLAPLCTVLVLLFSYALISLVVFVITLLLTSPDIVTDQTGKKFSRITLLELVHLRLTNSAAAITDQFRKDWPDEVDAKHGASKDAILLEAMHTQRLKMDFRWENGGHLDSKYIDSAGAGDSPNALNYRAQRFKVHQGVS